MDRRGFTLIELIMVIVLLGILAAVAIPKYVGLANEAKQAAEDGVVAAVRASLAIYFAEDLARGGTGVYPQDLEDTGRATPADQGDDTRLFEGMLQDPIRQHWVESGSNVYEGPAFASTAIDYTYDPGTGKFE